MRVGRLISLSPLIHLASFSPSCSLGFRQTVSRQLLPHLLHLDDGVVDSLRMSQLFHRIHSVWLAASSAVSQSLSSSVLSAQDGRQANVGPNSTRLLASTYLTDCIQSQPQLDLLIDILCSLYAKWFDALSELDRGVLDQLVLDVTMVSRTLRDGMHNAIHGDAGYHRHSQYAHVCLVCSVVSPAV